MYWWQDTRSAKLPYCHHWGHLCFEWKVATSTGPSCVCNRWSSLWPCQKGFTGYTTCWTRTRRNNPANIGNGLFFLLIIIFEHPNRNWFSRSSQLASSTQVYPMYKAFIEPDLQTAHIKITNKFNPFTGFQTPTYILKVTLYVIIFISYFMCILVAILTESL
jgi:hypothetical protein